MVISTEWGGLRDTENDRYSLDLLTRYLHVDVLLMYYGNEDERSALKRDLSVSKKCTFLRSTYPKRSTEVEDGLFLLGRGQGRRERLIMSPNMIY